MTGKCNKCFENMNCEGALCSECNNHFHFDCSIAESGYRRMKSVWKCPGCVATKTRSTSTSSASGLADVRKDLQDIKDVLKGINANITRMDARLNELERSVQHFSDEYDKVLGDLNKCKSDVVTLNKTVVVLHSDVARKDAEIQVLRETVQALDQYSRVRNLEIHGVREVVNEDCRDVIINIARELQVEIEAKEIDIAHRVQSANKNVPRPIVAQFLTRTKREELLSKRLLVVTNNNIPTLKIGSKVFINEHLSPYNKNLLRLAKIKAREVGFRYVWFRSGKLLAREDDGKPVVRISNEREISDKIKKASGGE